MSDLLPDPEYGNGAAPLTPYERARLRPSVDVAALARFLAADAGAARRLTIAYFARAVLVEDLEVLNPELQATWAAASPADLAFFVEPDGRRFRPEVSWDLQVHLDDPALAALWAAIEPRGPGETR
jgi:hypothetical protein